MSNAKKIATLALASAMAATSYQAAYAETVDRGAESYARFVKPLEGAVKGSSNLLERNGSPVSVKGCFVRVSKGGFLGMDNAASVLTLVGKEGGRSSCCDVNVDLFTKSMQTLIAQDRIPQSFHDSVMDFNKVKTGRVRSEHSGCERSDGGGTDNNSTGGGTPSNPGTSEGCGSCNGGNTGGNTPDTGGTTGGTDGGNTSPGPNGAGPRASIETNVKIMLAQQGIHVRFG